MPRAARKQSNTNIYHVMMRGINKQDIFHDEKDYYKMIQLLKYCIEKSEIEIYAYCLMPNHLHLLIKEGIEPLGITFRRLGSKYVYWYNNKYNRVGHLFQDRFKSEPVEDDSYFITVLRYIHLNPVKASIVRNAEDYKFSSYSNYYFKDSWISNQKALTILNKKQFIKLHKIIPEENCLDDNYEKRRVLTPEEAEDIFKETTACHTTEDFQSKEKTEKNNLIRKLREKGLTIRQIVVFSGESYYNVQKQSPIKEPSPDWF